MLMTLCCLFSLLDGGNDSCSNASDSDDGSSLELLPRPSASPASSHTTSPPHSQIPSSLPSPSMEHSRSPHAFIHCRTLSITTEATTATRGERRRVRGGHRRGRGERGVSSSTQGRGRGVRGSGRRGRRVRGSGRRGRGVSRRNFPKILLPAKKKLTRGSS